MKLGTAELRFPHPVPIDPAGFARASEEAGHRLRALKLELEGAVVEGSCPECGSSEGFRIRSGTGQVFHVRSSPDRIPAKGKWTLMLLTGPNEGHPVYELVTR